MDSDSDADPWKYFPFELGECEDLENYEPGGFHPVHLGDVYDHDRYRIVHKLGFGGFSTVWLAEDVTGPEWVALKIVAARESPSYEARSVIASHLDIPASRLFAIVKRKFWIDGPNGSHLCLVLPALGPNLSTLSRGIFSRLNPNFAKDVSLQAAQALVQLHSNGLCHGDFTANNIVLRLKDDFDSYQESDLLKLFGPPKTAPLRTYSGKPPGPHGPEYIVVPLDFRSSPINVLSNEICIIDFDQSFTTTGPIPNRPGIPAKYLAPEVAAGRPSSPASDIWALGCAIFRLRSGDDLFFDYDTNCPVDALRQIESALGPLAEEIKQTKFDDEGFAVSENDEGETFWSLENTRLMGDRVRAIIDEPPSIFINSRGEAVEIGEGEIQGFLSEDDASLRVPFADAFSSMVWRPTAICVDGNYFIAYEEDGETDRMLEAFPNISEAEAAQLIDLLAKTFAYDPSKRLTAAEMITHPWFKTSL